MSQDISQVLKKKAKNFLLNQDRLFRRTKKELRLVPDMPTRSIIFQGIHDDTGHWDFKSTYEFIASRFWWTNIRPEISSFVRSNDVCQKTKPYDREEFQIRIPISGLFNTWSADFAGPLPRTESGNQYLLVVIENMSKCPIARAIPAEPFNSLGVLKFVKEEIILPFGSPKFI